MICTGGPNGGLCPHCEALKQLEERMKLTISEEIRRGLRSQGSELSGADVGRKLEWGGGFGRVLLIDVGKRVWLKDYGLVMENEEQRNKRRGGLR